LGRQHFARECCISETAFPLKSDIFVLGFGGNADHFEFENTSRKEEYDEENFAGYGCSRCVGLGGSCFGG
jgi:hypothetical protein